MVLYVYACTNCMQNARFKPMHEIEVKLCCHLVFQMLFRNIQRQKSYRNFLGGWSELWRSIFMRVMYPNAICKTSDKSIENYRKNEENKISGHGSCTNKQ